MRNTVAALCIMFLPCVSALAQSEVAADPTRGLRDNRPDDYALTGVTVVTEPGHRIDDATILIEDTTIVAAGNDIDIPAGFMKIDLQGRMVYPGLIDAYGEVDVPTKDSDLEASYWNKHITPSRTATSVAARPDGSADKLRSQGITVRVVAPAGGILKGRSAVVLLNDESRGRTLLKPDAWQHAQLTVPRDKRGQRYPTSPMGAVALLRQAFYDARWYAKAWDAYRAIRLLPRPETNTALEMLSEAIVNDTFVMDAQNDRMALRADGIAKEFSLMMILRGSGQEYRQLDAIAATHRPILLPVDFPDTPDVKSAAAANDVTLKELLHWHFAPENPKRLSAAGVPICLTTDGLDDASTFLRQIRLAVRRGLPVDEALAAVTTTPASLLEIDGRVGTIRPGTLANLVVTDGELFDEGTKVLETWVAGQQFIIDGADEQPLDSVVGTWELEFDADATSVVARMTVRRKDKKLTAKLLSLPGPTDSR